MNKNIIIGVALILLSIGIFVGVKTYLDKDLDKQKEELNKTFEKYGTVEKETVEVSIAKFNTEVMDNNIGDPASSDYMTQDNNLYWFALLDSVYLYVKSENYTGNKNKDITKVMTIHYSDNEEIALKYVKALIKSNNDALTDSDVDYLMKESKNLSSDKKQANNGKGISVGFVKNEEVTEYQITRLY